MAPLDARHSPEVLRPRIESLIGEVERLRAKLAALREAVKDVPQYMRTVEPVDQDPEWAAEIEAALADD